MFYDRITECLEFEPPYCAVEYPFHWDVNDFIGKVRRGNFTAAFRAYRNAVVFPVTVSSLCGAPCARACPLAGEEVAIALNLLERAACEHTKSPKPEHFSIPAKGQRIAVIGAGPAGLACAYRFAERGYGVTVYEKTGRIGGGLNDLLDGERYIEEIRSQFAGLDCDFVFEVEVEDIGALRRGDAGGGTADDGADSAAHGAPGSDPYDAVYDARGIEGDAIGKIAAGLAAVNPIEAFLKTGRAQNEEPAPAMPEYGVEIYAGRPARALADIMRERGESSGDAAPGKDDAVREAERCLMCKCRYCTDSCDLIRFFKKTPATMGEEVRVTTGLDGLRGEIVVAKRLISSCNLCGICKTVCPKNIDMEHLFREAREKLVDKGSMPWAFNDWFLRDMAQANSGDASVAIAPASGAGGYAFFPGCHLGGSDPGYVLKSYEWLAARWPDTSIVVRCCGVPAVWAGERKLWEKLFGEIRDMWHTLGEPTFVFACPTCMLTFGTYLPEIEGVSLYELMADGGPRGDLARGAASYSVFDPCSSRACPDVQEAVRGLAQSLGFSLSPLPSGRDRALCCSYGGHAAVANPEYTQFVRESRIAEGEGTYITYCSNCRDIFAGEGKGAIHILDALFAGGGKPASAPYGGIGLTGSDYGSDEPASADGLAARALREPPTVTERQENRRRLKASLVYGMAPDMRVIGGSPVPAYDPSHEVKLHIPDALRRQISREYILEPDLAAVVAHCEATGDKVDIEGMGLMAGHSKIGHATYWVEYREIGVGEYELTRAYQHRMEIDEDGTPGVPKTHETVTVNER
ncbi:MAG: NAD(P)-binding protein [Clostridiales Family XIII bacterium]|jgi:Fe-S oxidoreductase|nr:NAD(P)-binding protein [Clostridiales Family XIII bacterium]